MPDHLQWHRNGWRVRVVVPPRLVAVIGKKFLLYETGTANYERAQRRAAGKIKEFLRLIGRGPKRAGHRQHVRPATTTTEWYAPPWLFDYFPPGVMFDLDVAAPPGGVPWVPARRYYTKDDDGLAQPWFGCVWCNPPFGLRNNMQAWLDRFIAHGNGVLFTSSNTYTKWWQRTAAQTDAVLPISGYVPPIDGRNMSRPVNASFGSCLFGMGEGVPILQHAAAAGLGQIFAKRDSRGTR